VKADKAVIPATKPAPKPAYVPVVRQHIEGAKPGPLFGDVVPVPDWADSIMFDNGNARLADVHLEASMDAETWSPMPPGAFRRATPATTVVVTRSTTPEERSQPGMSTVATTRVEVPVTPGPRSPQYVRAVVVNIRQRKPHYSADVTIEFRRTYDN